LTGTTTPPNEPPPNGPRPTATHEVLVGQAMPTRWSVPETVWTLAEAPNDGHEAHRHQQRPSQGHRDAKRPLNNGRPADRLVSTVRAPADPAHPADQ
jgi:hypothetical protein